MRLTLGEIGRFLLFAVEFFGAAACVELDVLLLAGVPDLAAGRLFVD